VNLHSARVYHSLLRAQDLLQGGRAVLTHFEEPSHSKVADRYCVLVHLQRPFLSCAFCLTRGEKRRRAAALQIEMDDYPRISLVELLVDEGAYWTSRVQDMRWITSPGGGLQ
jgi:hypothetical protein